MCPVADQVFGCIFARVAADEAGATIRLDFSNRIEGLRSIQVRHLNVHQHDVDPPAMPPKKMNRLDASGSRPHFKSILFQRQAEHDTNEIVVVDNQRSEASFRWVAGTTSASIRIPWARCVYAVGFHSNLHIGHVDWPLGDLSTRNAFNRGLSPRAARTVS